MSSRAASIAAALSAIHFWTICFSLSSPPCTLLLTARSHSMSNARRQTPTQRMQWWMRPGPSRFWASTNALALVAEQVLGRDPHVAVGDLVVRRTAGRRASVSCMRPSARISMPGVSVGTISIDMPSYGCDVGVGDGHDDVEVAARGVADEPLRAVDDPLVAVADGAGLELLAGPSRCPARSSRTPSRARRRAAAGASAASGPRWPPIAISSALPESGAWQPKTYGASSLPPRISCISPSLTWP